ncbi:hypothetical protein CRG98_029705 [Punica granatum]|uniref:Uncharacterized protein n=1 Tax=Punica granatum TaxID=22663 RepID=A0A2I0J109_PUNGR|nr:hypothetical protein CRG98_029705 [Punica granatum]
MTLCMRRKRGMTLVVSECGCKAAALRIGLTLGAATRLVTWESENRRWFTRRGRHDSPLVVILARGECPWGRGYQRMLIYRGSVS